MTHYREIALGSFAMIWSKPLGHEDSTVLVDLMRNRQNRK